MATVRVRSKQGSVAVGACGSAGLLHKQPQGQWLQWLQSVQSLQGLLRPQGVQSAGPRSVLETQSP